MIVAEDIMSEDVIVIYDDMLIKQVAHMLLRNRVSGYPVVKKDMGLVGIITITDLFRILNNAMNGKSDEEIHMLINESKDLAVGEVMTKDVYSIKRDTTLDEIVKAIGEKDIHTFPVLEDDKIVGIVSRHDVLNAIFCYDN